MAEPKIKPIATTGPEAPLYNSASMDLVAKQAIRTSKDSRAPRIDLVMTLSDMLYDDKTPHKGSAGQKDFTIKDRAAEVAAARNEAMGLFISKGENAPETKQKFAQWLQKQESFGMFAFSQIVDKPELMAVVTEKEPALKKLFDSLDNPGGPMAPKEITPEMKKAVEQERELRIALADTMTETYIVSPDKNPTAAAADALGVVTKMLGKQMGPAGQNLTPAPKAPGQQER